MPTDTAPLFDADHAAFMQRGVSLSVASCGHANLPSVARALGCRIADDQRKVRIMVSEKQAADVLAHVAQRGALAVVFSEPSTHRTVQLKGQDASVEKVVAADLQAVARYRASFVQELVPLGYDPKLIHALLACPDADLAVLAFTPNAAFSQTPGPNAGQALLVHA